MTGADVTVKVINRPTLAIKFIYWATFILIGLYIFSPWYTPVDSIEYHQELRRPLVVKLYGGALLATGVPGMLALAWSGWKYRHAVLEISMMMTFILFCFFAILRIFNYGIIDLAWVSYSINALVAGVVHFKLKLERFTPQ